MQLILVILFLAAALGYLGRLFYKRFIKKESHCDSCAFGNSALFARHKEEEVN